MNTQAWLWATIADDKQRNGKKAAKLCERSKGLEPEYLETLAAAHAEVGDFEKASEVQKKAIQAYGITPVLVEKCREQMAKKDGPLVETWELHVAASPTGSGRRSNRPSGLFPTAFALRNKVSFERCRTVGRSHPEHPPGPDGRGPTGAVRKLRGGG